MSTNNKQTELNQVIHSADTAYEDSLDRHLANLCNREEDTPETFELILSEKVFQLYYAGNGLLHTFNKKQRPNELYFIQAIEKVDEHGNYRMTTNCFATSDHIRRELEKLEIPTWDSK